MACWQKVVGRGQTIADKICKTDECISAMIKQVFVLSLIPKEGKHSYNRSTEITKFLEIFSAAICHLWDTYRHPYRSLIYVLHLQYFSIARIYCMS